jgi:hypothetical protein
VEGQLTLYGQVMARLSRPLADRDAVLWLVRLDEGALAELESACLTAMMQDAAAAVLFARAFAQTQALLAGRDVPPATVPRAQVAGSEGEADAAAQMDTLAVPATTPDIEDAMFTLASTTQVASPRGPKRRG